MKLITGIPHPHVLWFLGLFRYKGLWQPWVEQVNGCHFSKRVWSLHVPVSHLVIHTPFKTFYYYCTCYAALWSLILPLWLTEGLSCQLSAKESGCNSGNADVISEPGTSSGEGIGNLLQYSCLENSMDRGDWKATVHGVTKSWTWLSN